MELAALVTITGRSLGLRSDSSPVSGCSLPPLDDPSSDPRPGQPHLLAVRARNTHHAARDRSLEPAAVQHVHSSDRLRDGSEDHVGHARAALVHRLVQHHARDDAADLGGAQANSDVNVARAATGTISTARRLSPRTHTTPAGLWRPPVAS